MVFHRMGLLGFCVLLAASGQGSQTVRVNYQAKLTSGGLPLQGSHLLNFSFWVGGSDSVAGSGTQVFEEQKTLAPADGIVNHEIGTGTPDGPALSAATFSSDSDIYLQVSVDSLTNVLLPRTRVNSVPFALRAETADNAVNGVPTAKMIFGDSPTAPAGFTATGTSFYTSWQVRASMTVGRLDVAAAAANGKVFAIGGSDALNQSLGTNEAYDPISDSWSDKASMTTFRSALTCTELGGSIYAVGGFNSSLSDPVATSEVFNPATNSWSTTQSLTKARYGHCAAVVNGKLYVIGGSNNSGSLASVEEFNPGTGTWTQKADMPTSRSYAAVGVVGGKIYVMGGPGFANNEMFDPAANSWTTKAPIPVYFNTLYASGGFSFGGKIYITGGFTATPNCRVYDPATDLWAQAPPLTSSRHHHATALLNGKAYAIGGEDPTAVIGTKNEEWAPGIYYPYVKN